MQTIRKTQQVQRKANPPNTTSQKPQPKKAVSSPSTRVNQSPKVLTPTLHLVLVHFNDQYLLGIHDSGDIWIFETELCRMFKMDESGVKDGDFPDGCRAKIAVPQLNAGVYELSLINTRALYLFVRQTEEIIADDPEIFRRITPVK